MRTTVKTFRFPHPLADQLAREAEKRNCTVADIVREAIAVYFERLQAEAMILALEQRLTGRIDAQTQHIDAGLQKILALAVSE